MSEIFESFLTHPYACVILITFDKIRYLAIMLKNSVGSFTLLTVTRLNSSKFVAPFKKAIDSNESFLYT